MTRRVRLTVGYDGTNYAGWQWQLNAVSVQQCLEQALAKAVGTPIKCTGASRTDAGVHALGQVVHFDTDASIPPEKYPFALNSLLPSDIRVFSGQEADECFHARFDATAKCYTYSFINAPHMNPMKRLVSLHVPGHLQLDCMQEALPALTGRHDFAAFQATGGTAKTTIRNIEAASLSITGDEITFTIRGNAFLYNMVRIIAGTLIAVGMEKAPVHCFTEAFQTHSRLSLGPTAPAHGLCLQSVSYELAQPHTNRD